MKRAKPCHAEDVAAAGASSPAKVSLRSIYAEAMRDVLADPRKAIAEHDPWLLTLVKPAPARKP
jgi:hypothetical protein